ncbi:unnamed protein product [Clonostachys byssicola]|uniref:Uncharacterized protein n=1 Tax=Clonostachys byssicola TaxID=160290 RepID=A0A9N9U5H1_9HYPO|nr:unnamed protein product [Clonostachys byssicola]
MAVSPDPIIVTLPITMESIGDLDCIFEVHQGIFSDGENPKQLVFVSFPEECRAGNCSFIVWRRERTTEDNNFMATPCSVRLEPSTKNIDFVAPIDTALGPMPLSPGQYRPLGQPTDESLVARYHASREVLISCDFFAYNTEVEHQSEATWFVAVKNRFIEMAVLEPYNDLVAPFSEPETLDAAQPIQDSYLYHRFEAPN